ncbi:MAG: ATP-binding protein [Erysipelotrichaceae bacterium]|nr:ATP-binding protein [Erysipelotrichaceae bacterium]
MRLMDALFDISMFDSYKEDNRREVKKANGGLPVSLWETYSSMANTYGGVIILGVKEIDDNHWKTTGLKGKEKLLDDFWSQIHNKNKVSINLLTEKDIEVYEVDEDIVIAIHVPMAKREDRPVYINNDMFKGTYKRAHTGDYHCSRLQVKSMLRD